MIPENIFMFWKGKRPKLINVCLERVKKLHPGFKIEVLNTSIEKVRGYDLLSVQAQSDWVRICAIEKYGGIWLDATCFLMKPVTEWVDMTNGRLQGFSTPFSDECLDSWAFAASPNNELVRVWKQKFKSAIEIGFDKFKRDNEYLLKNHKVFGHMPYLTIHGCYIIASNMTNMKALMKKSCNGPFQYLCKNKFDIDKSIDYLIKNDIGSVPFIKFRGKEQELFHNRPFKLAEFLIKYHYGIEFLSLYSYPTSLLFLIMLVIISNYLLDGIGFWLLICTFSILLLSNTHRKKPRLAYIVRGFLYTENRVPNSIAGKKISYNQDIRVLWPTHSQLIKKLSYLYDVKIFFSTYDSTREDVKDWAQNHGSLIYSKENGSTQFTTVLKSLEELKNYDYYFITRSDITFKKPFFDLVQMYPQNVTVLNREKNGKYNDIIHFLPFSKYDEFNDYIRNIVDKKQTHAHDQDIITYDLLTNENVEYVRACNRFYTLLGHMAKNEFC